MKDKETYSHDEVDSILKDYIRTTAKEMDLELNPRLKEELEYA